MSEPINMTNAHRVAFIFLYFAIETDQQLASEEMIVISEKIENFFKKNLNKDENLNSWDIVSESLNWFNSISIQQKIVNYQNLMGYLKDNFTDNQKSCLIEDLKVLAKSDGVVLEAESALIKKSEIFLNN